MNLISGRRLLSAIVVVVVAQAAALPSASSAHGGGDRYRLELLGKAQPDECFNGIGVPYPPGPPCAVGQAKVNQSYVWGLAKVGANVWFGTGANVNCLVSGATLNLVKPSLNEDFTCEYGESQIAKANPQLPASVGDQRQPRIYLYDTHRRRMVEKTADVVGRTQADSNRLRTTLGLRAGGAHNGVVFLGGPSFGLSISLFAFDGYTGEYLGSQTISGYGNIRHFHVADRTLYAGVGVGRNGDSGGHVLRWTGDRANPFSFISVANLPSQAADLTDHQGRLVVSTWSAANATSPEMVAGIWMSPEFDDGAPGLDESDAAGWTQVWNATEYDPERVVAATYGLGGLASYGGYLYWGTMHVPMKSTTVFMNVYPQPPGPARRTALVNTQRAFSVFRGKSFHNSHKRIELLYGESQLPVYDPAGNGGVGSWSSQPTGYVPKHGPSGFGHLYNNYEWIMTVADGKLFVGTMDWSYLAQHLLPPGEGNIDPTKFGGELWVFEHPHAPAKPVSTTGLGNYLNYGVRNMIADGNTLYLGMANPMNLRTDPTDDIPEGGWELIKLKVSGR
jgi:hypothetical protein